MPLPRHPLPLLTLKQFLLRARVLTLYRTCLRTIRHITNPELRAEMARYARGEFERNRGERREEQVRWLVQAGKKELETMSRYALGRH